MKEKMTLESLRNRWRPTGKWHILCHDPSNVPAPEGERAFVRIAKLEMGQYPREGLQRNEVVPFWLQIYAQSTIAEDFHSVWQDQGKETFPLAGAQSFARTVHEELRDVLVRTGLRPVVIAEDDWVAMLECKGGLVLVTDTSAIRKGIVSGIARVLRDARIWVIVPVVSLFELQDAASRAKFGPLDKPKHDNVRTLKVRTMSTSATRELLTLQDRLPVEFLEVSIALLSRARGAKEEGERPVLPDRLLLEEIKRLKRSRGLTDGFFLLSTDWDLVRFARLERIGAIYVDRPELDSSGGRFYSARYDVHRKNFVVCTAHEFIWDLAHVFDCVRADSEEEGQAITIAYSFEGKSTHDWEQDILEVELET